jgi:hypothetical protein
MPSLIQNIVIVILFIFYNNCQSQTPDNDYVAIVAVDKMNVFYAGVDNPITAGITGIPASQITANIVGCDATITPAEPGKYVVRAKSAGKVTMTLSGKNKDGKIITQTRDFRVQYIPDPMVSVCCENLLGSSAWHTKRGLIAELIDFDFKADFKVLSFNMKLIQNDDILTCTNKGAVFEGFCYELQQRARLNSVYIIDNIIAIGPDERLRNLGELSFKIR